MGMERFAPFLDADVLVRRIATRWSAHELQGRPRRAVRRHRIHHSRREIRRHMGVDGKHWALRQDIWYQRTRWRHSIAHDSKVGHIVLLGGLPFIRGPGSSRPTARRYLGALRTERHPGSRAAYD